MRMTRVLAGVALIGTTGCTTATIDWSEPTSAANDSIAVPTISPRGTVEFSRHGQPSTNPPDSTACVASIAFARDGDTWYAAWNRLLPDRSVDVVAARLIGGAASWSNASIVDSVDLAKVGCSRPGPSIAVSTGYVHVVYSIEAPEGFGVFFAHSMDGTATFHSVLPVVYGDRLVATAVAADGMNVVVAYEDPNGSGHHVDVGISHTQGHTFEPRVESSLDDMSAMRPVVAVRGNMLAIAFADPTSGNRIVRVGHVH